MKTPQLPDLKWKSLRIFPRPLQYISRRETIELNLLAVIVGLGAGIAAIGFRALIGLIQNLALYHQWDHHLIPPAHHIRGLWILIILPLGLLISTLITRYFAKEAKGHGVPEVIEAVWTREGIMRKRIFLLKALASSITIASGGSVGREGPIVQIGSGLASSLGQVLKLKPRLLKTLIGCGAAGAIAATFNTPIAGVIFAIEIVILELKTKSFVPLVISSVLATALSRHYLGNEPAFFVPQHIMTGPHELIFYLILGFLAGFLGVFVIRFLYFAEDFFDQLKIPFWTKPLLAGLIVAAISLKYPQMLGVGYDFVSQTLQHQASIQLLFIFIFLKIFCTTLTLAGGGSGGVFAPSLFIGAMLGGSYGYFVHGLFPEWTQSYDAYALVGMAALFSATGRATFTAIVILFEMTLDYSIILPLMLVCVIADQTSWALFKDSIYSLKLKRKGLKFINDISVNLMSLTPVKDIMTTKLHVVFKGTSIKESANQMRSFEHAVFPVVDEKWRLLGVVPKSTLDKAEAESPQALIESIVKKAKAQVKDTDSAEYALKKIEKTRDPRILVISAQTSKLVGIISPINFVRINSKQIEAEDNPAHT